MVVEFVLAGAAQAPIANDSRIWVDVFFRVMLGAPVTWRITELFKV